MSFSGDEVILRMAIISLGDKNVDGLTAIFISQGRILSN